MESKRTRNTYDRDFKVSTIKLILERHQSVVKVSRDLGVNFENILIIVIGISFFHRISVLSDNVTKTDFLKSFSAFVGFNSSRIIFEAFKSIIEPYNFVSLSNSFKEYLSIVSFFISRCMMLGKSDFLRIKND